ncbi:MAG: P1 family peptidase [Coriobacteriales bacterium]|jgi:L-aminopeptidase/D-esterase-like protein|nr:P1 family peptidase [Coriobacteriales bacterium]
MKLTPEVLFAYGEDASLPNGIYVGSAQDEIAATGCTVILAPKGAICGLDVRGAAPATRESDLLLPQNMVQQVHAIVLAGGSAYGLAAADGVMRFCEERNIGLSFANIVVPIVVGACLFDLGVGNGCVRPNAEMGYLASMLALDGLHGNQKENEQDSEYESPCDSEHRHEQDSKHESPCDSEHRHEQTNHQMSEQSSKLENKQERQKLKVGRVGAGCGASVGKLLGADYAMSGGLGACSVRVGKLLVSAIVAVNAVGNIVDTANERMLSGVINPNGDGKAILAPLDAMLLAANNASSQSLKAVKDCNDKDACYDTNPSVNSCANAKNKANNKASDKTNDNSGANAHCENTTLGCIITNANVDKCAATRIATMAHDGYARAIEPVHTSNDGDAIYCLSTCTTDAHPDFVGVLAARVMEGAIHNAVCDSVRLSAMAV